jgi:transcriptional regulator with XRE-family HTH domain
MGANGERWPHTKAKRSPPVGVIVDKREKSDPHPIDTYVGDRMRLRRMEFGLSQSLLANKIGVSSQAMQKYESGDNRISASRLYEVSRVLEVPPAFFFDGYPDGVVVQNLARETFDSRELMSLLRAFYGIDDPHLRANILRLISRIGDQDR